MGYGGGDGVCSVHAYVGSVRVFNITSSNIDIITIVLTLFFTLMSAPLAHRYFTISKSPKELAFIKAVSPY